jgi:hypothetical protein
MQGSPSTSANSQMAKPVYYFSKVIPWLVHDCKHVHAPCTGVLQRLNNLGRNSSIQAAGGLIKPEQAGLSDQLYPNCNALALAT